MELLPGQSAKLSSGAPASNVKMAEDSSLFDLLPDEMVMKIVKMALRNVEDGPVLHITTKGLFSSCICKQSNCADLTIGMDYSCQKRTVLVRVISKISQIFKRLSRDLSLNILWSGRVKLSGSYSELKNAVQSMPNEVDIERLDVKGFDVRGRFDDVAPNMDTYEGFFR